MGLTAYQFPGKVHVDHYVLVVSSLHLSHHLAPWVRLRIIEHDLLAYWYLPFVHILKTPGLPGLRLLIGE